MIRKLARWVDELPVCTKALIAINIIVCGISLLLKLCTWILVGAITLSKHGIQ